MNELYSNCELLYAAGGYPAVKRYIEFVDARPNLGISMVGYEQAKKYRQEVLVHFKNLKKKGGKNAKA